MYNWSADEKKIKAMGRAAYERWKLEQMVNYGLQGEKLSAPPAQKILARAFYGRAHARVSALFAMAGQKEILTAEQRKFLALVSRERYFTKYYYFTGTALAAFHLHHRFSEDIDLFSEQEVRLPSVRAFIGKVQKTLKLKKVDF